MIKYSPGDDLVRGSPVRAPLTQFFRGKSGRGVASLAHQILCKPIGRLYDWKKKKKGEKALESGKVNEAATESPRFGGTDSRAYFPERKRKAGKGG